MYVAKKRQGDGENYTARSFIICEVHEILLGLSNKGR
jgi:hypothetical protein